MDEFRNIETHSSTLEIYETVTRKFLAEQPELPAGDFVELRFENLEKDPISELGRIYDELSLPGKEATLEKVRGYTKSLGDYRRGRYQLPGSTLGEIESRWKFALDHWGYGIPPSIGSS